jgi:exopolyphosphatase/guanosine-5'-triphosphate,3'-diphosphate pyrophosphatase
MTPESAGAPGNLAEGPVNGSVGGAVDDLASRAADAASGHAREQPGSGAPGSGPPGSGPPGSRQTESGGLGKIQGGLARRVAAIDCGTNSLRLLIADVSLARRELTDVQRRMEIVRLGQGVDATGRLAPNALARTLGVLSEYAQSIRRAGATAIRMVATSATRDASNAAEFTAAVVHILGVPPEVISGAEEARLSFTGATAELAGTGRAAGAQEGLTAPYLVVDIGGGSTEFVVGGAGLAEAVPPASAPPASALPSAPGEPAQAAGQGSAEVAGRAGLHAISTDIGCVRLTERYLHDDPPTAAQVAAATADIDAAIATAAAAVPVTTARTLVGLAGSVTTVTAIALGLPAYDPARIHHARISAGQVHEVTQRLLGQTREQRAAIGPMHPGRVDVIGAGALVLDRVLTVLGFAEVVASEHDILDGIAWSIAADDR